MISCAKAFAATSDFGESPYDIPILRDLASLSDEEHSSLSENISFMKGKYKDGENFALAHLRTILRQEGFSRSTSCEIHPQEADAIRTDFANTLTTLRDASLKYGRLEAWKLAADRWANHLIYPTPEELKYQLLSTFWELK